jgi:hypothetical protein
LSWRIGRLAGVKLTLANNCRISAVVRRLLPGYELQEAENQIVIDYEVLSRSYRGASTIEALMWCRRRCRAISPLILAAQGPRATVGKKTHDNDRGNRLRHRQVAGAAH